MKRLTNSKINIASFGEKAKSRLTKQYIEKVELNNRLCEFEDFIEDNGFESFEEFKKHFDIWNLEDDDAFIKDTDKWKLWGYRYAKNRFRFEMEQNKCLQDKWSKLKEIISNKQHIKDKATDFITLLGASGVEVFCEMLLKEMEKLEEQN